VVRKSYYVSAAAAAVAAAWIIYCLCAGAGWASFAIGALWLVLAFVWLISARTLRRRERLDEAAPAGGHDVLTLVRQGRKIEAIKQYRNMNPGVGLREAKRAVDEL
jgi:hypothetical protein